jgi:hypothetical protein
MTQKWNLQDIRPAEPRRRPAGPRPVTSQVQTQQPRIVDPEDEAATIVIRDKNKDDKRSYLGLSIIVVVLIASVFGLSAFLSKTTITVFPEFREPVLNAEFTAYPDKRDNSLSYEIMTIDATAEKQVTASGQEFVESQATGFIEIIKSTPGSERLIKNTRFRTPEGLIFKVQESVVVPGAVKDTTGNLVPGTIRAEVFAENPGQEYNLAANTKFDIPGFKESNLTELYNSIYAVNRDPFTNGYKGQKFIINDDELGTAKQALQVDLRNSLLERIKSEAPAGFIAFPDSISFTFQSLPTVQYGENLVAIKEQAFLQIPLFKDSDFASFLAKESIPTYNREEVRITKPEDLKFSYKEASTSASNLANLTSLTFNITGKPTIVWKYSPEKLQQDLAGKSKTSISSVLTAHPGIKSARVSSKPFWKRSFPEEPSDIVIVEVIGEDKTD